jgi:hypothetical protein
MPKHRVHVFATVRTTFVIDGMATPQDAAVRVMADPATYTRLQALPGYADDYKPEVLVDTLDRTGKVLASTPVHFGVELTHKQLATLVAQIQEILYVEEGDINPNKKWDSETLGKLAAVMEKYGLTPE